MGWENNSCINFKIAKKLELKIIIYKENPLKKYYSHKKRGGTITKPKVEEKGKYVLDLENLHRFIKKLTNEIIDVEKNIGEGTSNKILFKNLFRKPVG